MSVNRDPETDQQLPTKNGLPVIQQLIIEEVMQESLELGRRKYGTGLQPFNGRDPLLDLEEELRDALVYARQVRWERDNPPVTDGLKELRDGLLAALLPDGPTWTVHDVEVLLTEGPVAKAVQTLRREAFERGASPAVGVLLAEIQDHSRDSAYRRGLERAVELLTQAHAAQFHDAYALGVKAGLKQAAASVNQKQ